MPDAAFSPLPRDVKALYAMLAARYAHAIPARAATRRVADAAARCLLLMPPFTAAADITMLFFRRMDCCRLMPCRIRCCFTLLLILMMRY